MIEITNVSGYKFCRRKTKRLVEAFLSDYKFKGASVSLAVIKDKEMRKLNKEYRGIDKETDVLSFSNPGFKKKRKLNGPEEESLLGEIVINADDVSRLDKYSDMFLELNMKVSLSKARSSYLFYFLFAHGLLHLAGFNDEREKDRLKMLSLGKKLMDKALI